MWEYTEKRRGFVDVRLKDPMTKRTDRANLFRLTVWSDSALRITAISVGSLDQLRYGVNMAITGTLDTISSVVAPMLATTFFLQRVSDGADVHVLGDKSFFFPCFLFTILSDLQCFCFSFFLHFFQHQPLKPSRTMITLIGKISPTTTIMT